MFAWLSAAGWCLAHRLLIRVVIQATWLLAAMSAKELPSCSVTEMDGVGKGTRGGDAENAAAGGIIITVTDSLAVMSKESGTYSASISLHSDQFDAHDGVGATATGLVGGSANIVTITSGIDANIKANRAVTAEVDVGFLWFAGPMADASLGSVTVIEKNPPLTGGGDGPLDAGTGVAVVAGNLVGLTEAMPPGTTSESGGLSVAIEGNLGIGVWNLVRVNDAEGMAIDTDPADDGADGVQAPMCTPYVGSASSPVDIAEPGPNSSLVLDMDDPGTMAMQSGMAPGTYILCVTVDTAGPESNTVPIPVGEYMASAYALSGRDGTRSIDAVMVASGKIGEIKRNGASVSVAYLTTSEKHNQRLVIVNRGNRPITITDISFQTEDGTEADLTDTAKAAAAAGLGAIGPANR